MHVQINGDKYVKSISIVWMQRNDGRIIIPVILHAPLR